MSDFTYCVYPTLRRALRCKECTKEEFAASVGISSSNAWWWLTGKNQHTIETIRRLLKETGLTFEEAFR